MNAASGPTRVERKGKPGLEHGVPSPVSAERTTSQARSGIRYDTERRRRVWAVAEAIPASRGATQETAPYGLAAYPVERAHSQADALALCFRAALDRIAVPLARAVGAFVAASGWSLFGFARLEDHARE